MAWLAIVRSGKSGAQLRASRRSLPTQAAVAGFDARDCIPDKAGWPAAASPFTAAGVRRRRSGYRLEPPHQPAATRALSLPSAADRLGWLILQLPPRPIPWGVGR